MKKTVGFALDKLVDTLTANSSIRAIGLSTGARPLPKPGQGDIDIFIYAHDMPNLEQRRSMLKSLSDGFEQIQVGKIPGGHWGQGDSLVMSGVETWLLFSTILSARAEADAILCGEYLGRLDDYYYPIGRCAMWNTMRVLYDPDGFLQSLKDLVRHYPENLARAVMDHHLSALGDVEDLKRAVQCHDVLFFHFALDIALDHFPQALFALNSEYFPSRKRSEGYIRSFPLKPLRCAQRLRRLVLLGAASETLNRSYRIWETLVRDLESIVRGE